MFIRELPKLKSASAPDQCIQAEIQNDICQPLFANLSQMPYRHALTVQRHSRQSHVSGIYFEWKWILTGWHLQMQVVQAFS